MGTLYEDTNTQKPLSPMLNAAVMTITKRVWPQWFDLSDTDAPDSLKRLKKEHSERGRITVYSGASDNTIFGCPGVNQAFRAWHDWCHLMLDADFSLDGEARACSLQEKHIVQVYGMGTMSQHMRKLVRAEVIGQALHYFRHKAYVRNQRRFVLAYIKHGERVLDNRW